MSPAGGRRTARARRKATLTRSSGTVSRTSQSTILREQRSSHTARYNQPPPWRGRYVMSPTQTRLGAVGPGWPSKRLSAARTAGSESVVRGTNERGCWACKPWAYSTRRMRQRPTAWPWDCTSARSLRVL